MSDKKVPALVEFPLKGVWFYDRYTEAEVHAHRCGQVIARAQTAYQDVMIQQFDHLGRCLVVDGKIQSAEVDEYIYHELLVHPAMIAHPNPRRVLVCGGGEGAPLREILAHPTVESVVMVGQWNTPDALPRSMTPTTRSCHAFDSRSDVARSTGACAASDQASSQNR